MKIIYHGNCPDGFGAALVAWLELKDAAEYIPAFHNVPPPDVSGYDVLMLDFCYGASDMQKIANSAKSLTVIDHHAGAFPTLSTLDKSPNVKILADDSHSGAVLAWKHYHPEKEVPKLLRFIEDRDCHFNKLADSPAALLWLDTHPYNFQLWRTFLNFEDSVWQKIIDHNQPMIKKFKSMVSRAASQSVATTLAGYPASMCFGTEELASDVALTMANKCGGIGMVCVLQTNGTIKTSLRAIGIDLIPIAKALGGNGHSYAAAFQCSPLQIQQALTGTDILSHLTKDLTPASLSI